MSEETATTSVSNNPEDLNENENGEEIVDYQEALKLYEETTEDSFALIGTLSGEKCSYPEGYLKRQAIYSCLTCSPESKTDDSKKAGFCLACSCHCHEGHELVELYTKRNFRCDCGNSKFSTKCLLFEDKEPLNDQNQYNQNFQGTYCVCHRPYPDPEDPIEDEMMQCIICEDWYHSRHMNRALPPGNFTEMVCFNCVDKHEFLLHYGAELPQSTEEINVENTTETEQPQTEMSSTETSEKQEKCIKPKEKCHSTTLFFEDISWRKSLCTCDKCLEVYKTENVSFLLDPEDPVSIYRQKGMNRMEEAIEEQQKDVEDKLKSLDRFQLVEMVLGVNLLKRKLADFFEKFNKEKKVVREEDVRELFKELESEREKRKNERSYHCK